MILSVLVSVLVLGLVVAAVAIGAAQLARRAARTAPGGAHGLLSGSSVRRFFQYLLLAGLLFLAASGVTGLLGRLLDPDPVIVRDDSSLALQLTFTVIALPLWAGLAWWTRRRLAQDPQESASVGWAAYLTVVALVSLVVAMTGWQPVLVAAAGPGAFEGSELALAIVWTVVWAGHRWWGNRVTPPGRLRAEELLGSLVGLLTAASGFVLLLSPALRELFGMTEDTLVGGTVPDLLEGGSVFAVGAAVWAVYWLARAVRGPRDTGWLALVLLVGIAGGLLTAVVSVSRLGYDVLVWLVGDPSSTSASVHFRAAPDLVAAAVVGLLVWWYHREVLEGGREPGRSEVRRVYEYVLAAVGLVAASAGLVMVLVTLVEAIAAGPDVLVGGGALNALLAAVTLLAVGLPVWWWHWRQAQSARAHRPVAELASPTRRTYLLVLFGLAGVVAVVALITLVYLVLDDALGQGVDLETMRRIRFPFGILATTSLLSAYHWTIFRADREAAGRDLPTSDGEAPRLPAPRSVLLVGAADPGIVSALAEQTGAEVDLVVRTDVDAVTWSLQDLAAAVTQTGSDLLVVADGDGFRTIPVQGRPSFPDPVA